jgi:hypothetical protein
MGILGNITDAIGLTDNKAAETYAKDSEATLARAAQLLKDVNLPDIEKQRIIMELPEVVGYLQAEQLGQSGLESVKEDPRLRNAQMNALQMLQDRGREGLTADDRLAFRELQDQAAGQEQARQRSILSEMAQRGTLDSGASLATQLASSQASAQQQQAQASQMARAAIEAKRNALAQSAQTAGNLSQQDYGRQSDLARSRDIINQFNTSNRQNVNQQNLATQQRISEAQASGKNQQNLYNAGLYQQQFTNEMAKAGAQVGVIQNQASQLAQQAAQQGAANQAITGALINAGTTYATAGMKPPKKED